MTSLDQATHALIAIRTELDAALLSLSQRLPALECGQGCNDCCDDGLTVFDIEAEIIRRRHAELLAEGVPAPAGRCAFLGAVGECRIYTDRPYVCRTQGLPLRWYEETEEDGEIVEERAICPKNQLESEAPPQETPRVHVHLPTLPEDDCWLLGPYEERLSTLQGHLDQDHYRRVPLRSLFSEA